MKVYDGKHRADERDRIKVGIAECEVTTGETTLTTSGLGSCVGVAVYDPGQGRGGLVHAMLPSAEEMDGDNPAKFADSGTELLLAEMKKRGSDVADVEAKIAGGSEMLDLSEGNGGVGPRNARSVRETLGAHGVPIVAEDVGGEHGRSLRFEPWSGELIVKAANEERLRL